MRPLLTLILFFSMTLIHGQEQLLPLKHDYAKKQNSLQRQEVKKGQHQQKSNVLLPFIDDFSQDHFPGNADGNEVLWEDFTVSIHSSFGINPPSTGVAVFDGLNELGLPYNGTSSSAIGYADSLTSMPMDLSGKTDVVLSFYFQPQGRGEAPESSDSLIVQYYEPISGIWLNKWHATGSSAFPYSQVLLAVDPAFLQDGFKFRFRNYGKITGALDHWSIDWVYLDENRSLDNEVLADVGFVDPPKSLLSSDLRSIPWDHYQVNPSALTRTVLDITIRNNRTSNSFIPGSGYSVYSNGSQIASFTDIQAPSIPANSDLSIEQEINSAPNSFVFPVSGGEDEATFKVEFSYTTSPDLTSDNNSMSFEQVFDNYYAYDDGQADYAYGITNFNGAGRVAFRYDLENITDTLRALDMYFLYQALENGNLEDQLFYITVWDVVGDQPGEIIYQDASPRTVQLSENNEFVSYGLEEPLELAANSSFFIGWVQPDDNSLNIGNDLSSDQNQGRLYYDVGNGWHATSFSGAIMMRPVFPPFTNPPVGITEEFIEDLQIWPNPSQDILNIQGEYPVGTTVQIFDLGGRSLMTERLNSFSHQLDLSALAEGMYMLEFKDNSSKRRLEKIVVSR